MSQTKLTRKLHLRGRRQWSVVASHATANLMALLFVSSLPLIGGCGSRTDTESKSSETKATSLPLPSTNPGSESKADTKREAVPAAPTNGHVAAEIAAEISVADFQQEVENQPEVVPSQIGEEPASVPLANEEPTASQSIPQPTPEQLSQWIQPQFTPLRLLACQDSTETGLVSHLASTVDGLHYITAGTKVILWSVKSETPEHVFCELPGEQLVKSLAVSPNGKWFAVGDSTGMLRMWSIADRREINSKQLYSNDIIQIAIAPDGQEMCTISYGDEVSRWSAQQLEPKGRFKVDTDGLKRIEYMSNDVLVAAGQTTSSWNVRSGELDKALTQGRYNYTLACSPDGTRFLFGDKESLNLWSISAQNVGVKLTGGFASDELAAFSGDGKNLATASGFSIRIWDIASGKLVQVIDAFGFPITGLNWLPNSNLLVVSSLNGRIRTWGTEDDGKSLGLQPLHAPVVMPNVEGRDTATPTQLLHAIDLRTFPRLPDALLSVASDFSLLYECSASMEEAQMFYRYQLGKAGWNESVQTAVAPNTIRFQKAGFALTTSFYSGSQLKTMVSVSFGGNYDLRWIPKLDVTPIEVVFENEDTVLYRTQADMVVIETTLLRKLHEAGWTAYSRLNSSQNDEEDSRNLNFLRGSTTLNVSITRDPTDPAKFNVQYARALTTKSVPVPQDSGFVEFDGSTQPMLVATTAMNLQETREFYDRAMVAEGWLIRASGRSVTEEDKNWLSYIRGQQDVTVGLESLPNGKTRIVIGEDVARSSWQLAKAASPIDDETKAAGLEAADFPVLNESKIAKYDSTAKSIEISMDEMPLLEVGKLYQQRLLSMGWELDGNGITETDYVFLTFTQNKVDIELRARITGGESIINIQGDGIQWNKPLGGGKQAVSYEKWLRMNHHPATLQLLDQYQTEMR